MADARFILDLPAPAQVAPTQSSAKQKPKKARGQADGRSRSERELDRLLHDQKTFIGSHSSVFHEVRNEVRQSLLEEKKRIAEEEWEKAQERKRAMQKRRWVLQTTYADNGNPKQTFWVPLSAGTEGKDVESEGPFPAELLRRPTGSDTVSISQQELECLTEICALPAHWTIADLSTLVESVETFGERWIVIADRIRLPKATPHTPAGAKKLAAIYYSLVHHILSKRSAPMESLWHSHPLNAYYLKGESPPVNDSAESSISKIDFAKAAKQRLAQKSNVKGNLPVKRVALERETPVKADLKYTGFLSGKAQQQQKLFSLHDAVLFPEGKYADAEVDALIRAHVKPAVFVASERIYEKMKELRNRIRLYLDAKEKVGKSG